MKKKTIIKVLTTMNKICCECGNDCRECNIKINVLPIYADIPAQDIELIADIIKERIDKEKNNA